MYGIDEYDHGAGDTQVPEHSGYHDFFLLLRFPPLHDETQKKHELSEKTDEDPEVVAIHTCV